MAHKVVIAAPNQITGYELRSLVEELDDFTVLDVADSTPRLEAVVTGRDPEIALVHERLGPVPVLQTIRELVARRPGTAVILVAENATPEVFSAAMDAGARGVLNYPSSLDEIQTRLTATAQWISQMRKHLTLDFSEGATNSARGQLVVVAGSKGGVGTTTVATHLAHNAVTRVPGRSVCLIDLDLEKGDVTSLLGITHRLDISDLAKVADDLGAQTLNSAIHRAANGLSTVLSPARLEDVGFVGERETILILAALRQQFDLVVADVGSHVTPASAAAVETATEVLLVTTPDVLALRGVHRTLDAWRRFGSRQGDAIKILLNKVSRDSDIQPDTAARLVPIAPITPHLVLAIKHLERGVNHQSPDQIISREWWNRIEDVAEVLHLTVAGATPVTPANKKKPRKRRDIPALANEQGQATLEFTALFPLILLLVVVVWQVGLWGVSAAYAGHAADEAAREASLGSPTSEVQRVALDAVPSWFAKGIEVTQGIDNINVKASLPLLVPGVSTDGLSFSSRVSYTKE